MDEYLNMRCPLQARDGSWMSISPKSFEARQQEAALSLPSTSQPQVNAGQQPALHIFTISSPAGSCMPAESFTRTYGSTNTWASTMTAAQFDEFCSNAVVV